MPPPPHFSVLLPTRDRLELAKSAIETVRRQTYSDWEIVVADNCSADDVAGFVKSLNEPRIVYTRSDQFLPVTENWNRALAASSGQFVVMLGDDDGLTPGYFERALAVVDRFGAVDFLYHGAYHFAFPGVLPGSDDGRLTDVTLYHVILRQVGEPELMPPAAARAAARKALDMWAVYGFNMQYFLFSRSFIERLAGFGPFFQGPFPDFYAANMSMLLADRICLIAEPWVMIGISPKSYGAYHFNRREKGGVSLLQGAHDPFKDTPPWLRARLLPGTNMLSSWLASVAIIPERLREQGLALGVNRYRLLQIIHNLRGRALGEPVEAGFGDLWPRLNWRERMFAAALWVGLLPCRLLPGRYRNRWAKFTDKIVGQFPPPPRNAPGAATVKYRSILEVYTGLAQAEGRGSRR